MSYGDANAVAMEIGEFGSLPVVEETPVIRSVRRTSGAGTGFEGQGDGRFRSQQLPHHCFRWSIPAGSGGDRHEFSKEVEMVSIARKMDLFSIVYVATASEAVAMAEAGADAIIVMLEQPSGGVLACERSWSAGRIPSSGARRLSGRSRKRARRSSLWPTEAPSTPRRCERIMQHTDVLACRGQLAGAHGHRIFPPHANLQGHPCSRGAALWPPLERSIETA